MFSLGPEFPAYVGFTSLGGIPSQLTGTLQIPFFVRGVIGDEWLRIRYLGTVVFNQPLSGSVPEQLYTAEIPVSLLQATAQATWTFDMYSCSGAQSQVQVVIPLAFSGCSDGEDEDGDGLVDYASDPGCSAPNDIEELPEPSVTFGLAAGAVMLLKLRRRRAAG